MQCLCEDVSLAPGALRQLRARSDRRGRMA